MTDSNDIDRNAPAPPLFPEEEIAREEARLAELEKDVLIFDYADRGVPMLDRMFEKRLRAYRSIGYEPSGHPPWD